MHLLPHQLELLSPARDADIAKQAILHGADAVYIGGPSFGARHNACNSIKEIADVVTFAHRYGAKVFVTFNTILHDHELEAARQLIYQFYDAGVDALIVQDMGILALDIPPIDLHASTQTDIRTAEKAQFLADVGFSQLVLARELNLAEIRHIHQTTSATLEFFIHGALCVAFSGQCYISHAQTGRSANRGDCSQACRLPYTLKDAQGRVVAYDKHLLSMKDNNQTANLIDLIDAGVRSFKIEGRYKDMGYVKNITAHYRQQLDVILNERPDLAPASYGHTTHLFTPNPDKTFHRGSTDYFVHQRQTSIGAFDSPKFIGLTIGEITKVTERYLDVTTKSPLTNGDGLNVLVKREIVGFRANTVEKINAHHYRVYPNDMPPALATLRLPQPLNRNLDHHWQQSLLKTSSERRLLIDFHLHATQQQLTLLVTGEDGTQISQTLAGPFDEAKNPDKAKQTIKEGLAKLGQTHFVANTITLDIPQPIFITNAQLNQLRRTALEQLAEAQLANYQRTTRKPATTPPPVYPDKHLTFLANVYNQKAREFYHRHGVELIDAAYEAHEVTEDAPVMITKHCLRFAFHLCPKQAKGVQGVRTKVTPMQLVHQDEVLTLKFDCKSCEMQVWGKIKPHVLKAGLPGSELIHLLKIEN